MTRRLVRMTIGGITRVVDLTRVLTSGYGRGGYGTQGYGS